MRLPFNADDSGARGSVYDCAPLLEQQRFVIGNRCTDNRQPSATNCGYSFAVAHSSFADIALQKR